nr:hypothetical protein [uncultured Pseudodesulfovibrio sp.]
MKKCVYAFCLLLIFGLLPGCSDDIADDPNLSSEGKTIVEEVGGPFSESEFKQFLEDIPKISTLTAWSQHDMTEADGAALSSKILAEVKSKGWDEERFMYIYSHSMAMVNMEQLNIMNKQVATQMEGMPEDQKKMMEQMFAQQMGGQMEVFKAEVDKQVPLSEQDIIRNNMNELCTAFGLPRE